MAPVLLSCPVLLPIPGVLSWTGVRVFGHYGFRSAMRERRSVMTWVSAAMRMILGAWHLAWVGFGLRQAQAGQQRIAVL